eukprot:5783315-Prymnesium_polylepis.1
MSRVLSECEAGRVALQVFYTSLPVLRFFLYSHTPASDTEAHFHSGTGQIQRCIVLSEWVPSPAARHDGARDDVDRQPPPPQLRLASEEVLAELNFVVGAVPCLTGAAH